MTYLLIFIIVGFIFSLYLLFVYCIHYNFHEETITREPGIMNQVITRNEANNKNKQINVTIEI